MSVDFGNTFGGNSNKNFTFGSGKAQADQTERRMAKYWLNIGYQTDNDQYPFVSIPAGIALDTMVRVRVGRNEFGAFNQARNDLLDQILSAGEELEPGETRIINLQVELRRVQDDVAEAPIENNQFARKIDL